MSSITLGVGVAAYIVGMFPTAFLMGRCIKRNPATEGSGNPGASNVYRIGGLAAGLTVGIVDMAKGALPILIASSLWDRPEMLAAWLGSIVGHIWPALSLLPGNKLRGGKGISTSAGGILVLDPMAFLLCIALFAVVCWLTRITALGSLSVTVAYPIIVVVRSRQTWEIAVTLVVALLVVWRHRSNLKRLRSGREFKV